MEKRKKKHIELTLQSQTLKSQIDTRFEYEPLLNAHPQSEDKEFQFLGKSFRIPVSISNMTEGTKLARKINTNLAKASNEFGMGICLGSCRIILDDNTHFNDFN